MAATSARACSANGTGLLFEQVLRGVTVAVQQPG